MINDNNKEEEPYYYYNKQVLLYSASNNRNDGMYVRNYITITYIYILYDDIDSFL